MLAMVTVASARWMPTERMNSPIGAFWCGKTFSTQARTQGGRPLHFLRNHMNDFRVTLAGYAQNTMGFLSTNGVMKRIDGPEPDSTRH